MLNFSRLLPTAISVIGFSCISLSTSSLGFSGIAHAAAPAVMAPTAATEQGKQLLFRTIRELVAQDPSLADGVGQRALLQGVQQSVQRYPSLRAQITAVAKSLRPELSAAIDQYAAPSVAINTVRPAPMVNAAMPTNTAPTFPQESEASPSTVGGDSGGLGVSASLGIAAAAAAATVATVIAGETDGDATGAALTEIETTEYTNEWGLVAINASNAYLRGATGEGIRVAVLDTGLDITHSEIDGNLAGEGSDTIDDDDDVTDEDGHGTHVAGTIAAERDDKDEENNMHGVAYNAEILPVRVLGTSGGTSTSIASGVEYAIENDARVINGSFGINYDDPEETEIQLIDAGDATQYAAYKEATDAGIILVFSAGNNFEDNPVLAANAGSNGLYPYIKPENADTGVYDDGGEDYDFSDLEGMLLTVVATQEDGEITSFSNRCGVAADWCIAAPGGDILSLEPGGGYQVLSGTSMAAPHVSGAVALLLEFFPELTPQEIVERLLETADKSGIYDDETVYGQGMLDLDAATQPVGSLSVATGDSIHQKMAALDTSRLSLGAAFGDGLRAALVGKKLAVFDRQRATFTVDLSQFAQAAHQPLDLDAALRRFRSRSNANTLALGHGATLRYAVVDIGQQSQQLDPAVGEQSSFVEASYRQRIGTMQWLMGYNTQPAAMYGIYQSTLGEVNASLAQDAFAAPYLSLAKQGYSLGTSMPITGNLSFTVGAFHGHSEHDQLRRSEDRAESFGQMLELAYRQQALALYMQGGFLHEEQAFLGTRSEGAFDTHSGTRTSFMGLGASYEFMPNWSLVGSYYRGVSSADTLRPSLLSHLSEIGTESFTVGVLGRDVWLQGDQLGLLGNQPLRVTSGDATLSLAAGRTRSGSVFKENYDVNLAPTGREIDLEAFYHMQLDTSLQMMSSVLYRNEPGHIQNTQDEAVLLLQLQKAF